MYCTTSRLLTRLSYLLPNVDHRLVFCIHCTLSIRVGPAHHQAEHIGPYAYNDTNTTRQSSEHKFFKFHASRSFKPDYTQTSAPAFHSNYNERSRILYLSNTFYP